MPNFSVPNQINPGDALDANKAMANWNQVVTDLNGAKIDATNTAASFAKDNVEPAFSGYKTAASMLTPGALTNGFISAAATFVFLPASGADAPTDPNAWKSVFEFDPADWLAGSRTTKLRLRVQYLTNGTQSGVTTTFGLYPVNSISGGQVTLGAVTAGSTVAFANPAINTLGRGNSGDFTAPASGFYALGLVTTGAFAASAQAVVTWELQVRQV